MPIDSPAKTDQATDTQVRAESEALLGAIRRGDREAFSRLYDLYAPLSYTLARRVVGDDAEAEAILSDVFLEIWANPHRYDASRGTFRTYLLVLTRSRAIDRLRARKRREERNATAVDELSTHSRRQEDSLNPRLGIISREHQAMVREAVDRLGEQQRAPLLLAYFDGLTHREIAERLGEPLGTVKTRIRAGLSVLRRALKREEE